jgi:hypothetical protein
MTTGSNVSNSGIYHLANYEGGEPWCRNRRAHQTTTPERAAEYDLRVCTKCLAIKDRWERVRERRQTRRCA